MKRLFLVLFAVAFVNATPINNPCLPSYIYEGVFFDRSVSFRAGYEGNFVSDARLKQSGGSSGRVDNFKINANSGSLTFDILNWFDLFSMLGASRIHSDWRVAPPSGGNFRLEMETRYHFSWTVGGKCLIYKWENTSIGISGRYFSVHPKLSWLTIDGQPVFTGSSRVQYKEWQVALGIAHKIGIFVPYAGIKFSDADANLNGLASNIIVSNDGSNALKMRRKEHVGAFLGVTLTNGKKFLLNIEARLADEEAATVSGEIRF